MTVRMPALFVGHGSPMNAIEDNAWTRDWAKVAGEFPRPKAIVCVSAHWETLGLAVTADEAPRTIHDFGGFPQALFDVRYPAPGSPELARRIAELLAPAPVRQADDWGLDHGAWSVLARMYPDATIPVVQLSLDRTQWPLEHADMGRRLAPLRDEGVLVLGSGDIVHNLRAADFRTGESPDWARRFNEEAKRLILAGDLAALAGYDTLGPDAELAINSAEHYLPLLYVLALREAADEVRFFADSVFAAISMTSVVVG
jgi:4,5-DOPA dioxygenase extradiol